MERMNDSSIKEHEDQEPLIEEEENMQPVKIPSHGFIASFRIIFRYLMADMKKKQQAFKIGFGTVLIVVTFVTALESALQIVPLAFLKIAENQVGEADIAMMPTKTIIYNPGNLDV